MLKILIKQTNWSILGALFGFLVGFLIKGFLVKSVGLSSYGLYIKGYVFITFVSTIISFAFPQVILKFLPINSISNKKDNIKLSSDILSYVIISGLLSSVLILIFSSYISEIVFDNLSMNIILQLSAIYLPLILLNSILSALYRGVLKIKEIIIYGTFLSVTLRAFLTLIIFNYTDKIHFFIAIEILVQFIVVIILWTKFSKDNFSIYFNFHFKRIFNNKKILTFAKSIFVGSTITYFGSELLTIIVSLFLPEKQVGAYSLMLTISSVSLFLLINLNKVFAPIISELYEKNNINQLNIIYKKVTFLINAFSIPFILLILFFIKHILAYFGDEMLEYMWLTIFMFLTLGASLPVGSSGVIMNMAGLEKQNMYIQIFKSVIIILIITAFIRSYHINAVVFTYVFVEYIKNYLQVYLIYKKTKIHPFTIDLFFLYVISIPFIFYFIYSGFNWVYYDYFIIPLILLFVYYIISFKKIKNLYLEVYE